MKHQEPTVRTNVVLTQQQLDAIQSVARADDRSVSSVIRRAVATYLADQGLSPAVDRYLTELEHS